MVMANKIREYIENVKFKMGQYIKYTLNHSNVYFKIKINTHYRVITDIDRFVERKFKTYKF